MEKTGEVFDLRNCYRKIGFWHVDRLAKTFLGVQCETKMHRTNASKYKTFSSLTKIYGLLLVE